ncbi:hypothetical protein HOY80DRAFT_1061589 [Tuber brumale]|nr:hypothetical protein HOY80DRAFT_1061589 [Tuber brumale]
MLVGGYTLELREKNAKKLIGNLIEKDGRWENDDLVIMMERGVEKIMIGGEGKEEIVNLVMEEEENREMDMGLKEEEYEERVGLEDSKNAGDGNEVRKWKIEFMSASEILGESEKKKGNRREEFIVWEDMEKERGGGLVEDWKLKKRVEDKMKKEEGLRREKKVEYDRGRERGIKREEVKEAGRDIKDWLDMVEIVTYVFGLKREKALGYSMNVKIDRSIILLWRKGG